MSDLAVNNMVAQQQKRYMKLSPSNSGSASFSYSKGNPVIRFAVAEADAYLIGTEVRLNFNLNCYTAGTTQVVNEAQVFNMSPNIGTQAIIQTLSVSSRRYATSLLETIHNYPRLCSSLFSTLHDARDTEFQLYNEQKSSMVGHISSQGQNWKGDNSIKADETLLRHNRKGYAPAVAGTLKNGTTSHSIRLVAGTFMSNDINLKLLGGLEIEIHLAPDSNVFFGANASSTSNYVLTNVSLTAPILYMNPQQVSNMGQPQTLSFLSWSSLYNVITSTDASVVNRVGLKRVLSTFQNYIPTDQLNNFTNNGMSCYDPGVKRLTYHRNGQRYPLEYAIQVNNSQNLLKKSESSLKPQVLRNYLSVFRNFRDIKHSSIVPENIMRYNTTNDNTELAVFGTGCNFDEVSAQGIDLETGTFGFTMESKLWTPGTDDGATTKDYGVFQFFLAKNTIVVRPGASASVIQ
tara:strand:+ start:8101 stop:9483 length:1383 start_codon:yes stop_codon:yes gene_type:complete